MKRFKFTDILIGLVFTLLFISIGVIAAVNFRFIYYMDISNLNIEASSGISRDVILENYDALIDYNSPFYKGDLKFPTLPASPSGLKHFSEVKNIFVSFYYIGIVTLIAALIIIVYKRKKKDFSYLMVSSITVLVIPAIVAIGCAINFDQAFIIFHKIFFRNNYWLFDPATDPIITILPDTFFLHALIVIIAFVVLGSLILFLFSRRKRRGRFSYDFTNNNRYY
ncbi:TIGR01906 family membrane protein [Anaerocolumna sedimenticola]|uniref:TIGR01906 family membrane protein n=1 Tax=Anaerocolumna sedimenticola TaxID=2696063 RepID=A0A6P1TK77_9FIRM|nr:TIGR01906 family membrane protein [Anaerocolumna sedimenticola]QHQ59678.1 TIGR01906 family membrane protein [Anaerocolumna sedimenticola]